ncbi:tartrate dehydrogenase [Ammoniphilus resinae]|uniref:D-malate dehydrogenase (decarboxylating) n=1 Tax=Ammoniphilus resinae TaxID=861532 RepID=A0ABS4GIQ0_9BACL|nr:tartrate dehydrogenase [Ammoniphilus resinae]MBP1930138.1 tartrate dehydrogenase/decarboxylase/D-malate dehydrogenase [Ammoniphilus resinae]
MRKIQLAVVPGDGVGKEVVPAAIDVLHTVAEVHGGFQFEFTEFPWNSDYYVEHGKMMPDDGINILSAYEGVFLGSIGNAKLVPDRVSTWDFIIKIRREFEQSINLRPAKYFKGLKSPLVNPRDFDLVVVRENSEGEYSQVGGRIYKGEDELAIQNAIFSRKGSERAMRFAFELARKRRNHVTSATKSNGIFHSMPFWDEVFDEVKKDYQDVDTAAYHIDALTAYFVTRPETLDVVVASNLFGDILSDLGGAILGSIGIAPAANINLNGKYPSMFEPVHGSAPDIYGKGIANPIGQIWTAKMMLDQFGFEDAGSLLLDSIGDVIESGFVTPDLGGKASTTEVAEEIARIFKEKAK